MNPAGKVSMLRDLLPPDFDLRDVQTKEGRLIAADWWEENSDARRAEILRTGKLLEPHFPLAMILDSPD